jgi:hypothetical protein
VSWEDEWALGASLVYVGRPSVWGNPYVEGPDGTRAEVIAKYREYLEGNPALLAMTESLRGKVLACWCAPQACHGDVLKELADRDSP